MEAQGQPSEGLDDGTTAAEDEAETEIGLLEDIAEPESITPSKIDLEPLNASPHGLDDENETEEAELPRSGSLVALKRSHSDDINPSDDVGRLSKTGTALEQVLMERFSNAEQTIDQEQNGEWNEEEEDEDLEDTLVEPMRQTRSIWDDLDSMRKTHSDASHNLFSPENSRTLLYLRQKSYVTIFESLALVAILEQLELELEVLGHAFPGHFIKSEEVDFMSYDERFSRETKERELFHLPSLKDFKDPFIVDESQLGTAEERLAKKLQKDRAFLYEIVVMAKEEMAADRTFESLKNHVRREDNRRNEEVTLLERMDKAFLAVKKLKHRMTEYEAQMSRHEQNRKEMIRELRDQLHAEKMKGKADARYSRGWHQAHNRFHYETLRNDAEIAKLRLKDVEIQMTRDRLVHKNLEAWNSLRCDEILLTIKSWQDKLEADIENIEKRISSKQEELRNQTQIIQDLEQNIESRRIEMAPWEEEKERQRLERIEYLRLYYSARKIQRWWRAYMLKHNLYKKKPKLRKGKKSAKGAGRKGKSKGKKKSKPKSKKKAGKKKK